ncbi:MAG: hypothetical protein JNJ73_13795 [Hyphomonadaceae bacterium]|nr:hypothetical protein [Hyphomonadaceae bacterium]
MRGHILGLEATRGVGLILGVDGARLEFPLSEWRSEGAPAAGQAVDYVLDAGQAKQVYAVPAGAAAAVAPGAPRSNTGSVLGGIAIGCLALGFLIPLVPTIAALILGLIGARRAQEDNDETGLVLSRIGWIGAVVLLGLGLILLFGALLFFGGLMSLLGAWGWALPAGLTVT